MGRIVINKTENKQTVILNDSHEEVTGGYFDSEEVWHEFGGGGGLSLHPIVHITLVNEGGENPLSITNMVMEQVIANEHLNMYYTATEEIPVNGEYSWDSLCPVQVNPDDFSVTATLNGPQIIETDYSGSGSVEDNYTVRSAENCSFEDGEISRITVTDATKDASLVLVTKFTINGGHH